MRRGQNLIYVGIKGTVSALDRASGQAVWSTKLKGYDFVNLILEGEDLFAAARGEVFCLDPETGSIRWNNSMPGFGWGLVTIATPGGSTSPGAVAAAEYQQRAAAQTASSSSSTGSAAG